MFRCFWTTFDVLFANFFRSGSLPLLASAWNSAKSFSWSFIIMSMYSLSFFQLPIDFPDDGTWTPLEAAMDFSSLLACEWSFTMRSPNRFTSLCFAFWVAMRPPSTSIIPPSAALLMKRLSFALKLAPELPPELVLAAGEAEVAGIARPLVGGLLGREYPPICAEAFPARQRNARPTAPTLQRVIIVIVFVISI